MFLASRASWRSCWLCSWSGRPPPSWRGPSGRPSRPSMPSPTPTPSRNSTGWRQVATDRNEEFDIQSSEKFIKSRNWGNDWRVWSHAEVTATLASKVAHLHLPFSIASTGGVSYTVGGAAAPPTLSLATPTSWLALPNQFLIRFGVSGFKMLTLTQTYAMISKVKVSRH